MPIGSSESDIVSLASGYTPRGMLAGIGLAIAATACFATLDTTTKFISASVPLMMALWVRYASQAVATTLVALPARGKALLKTANPKFQLLRGLLLMGSSMFAFFSLKHMPVGEFTAIVMIAPLVITVLAAIVLHEKVSVLRWLLVLMGFAGTLLIIRPSGASSSGWAVLLPLGLVSTNAAFQIVTSRLARTEDPLTMHFYTGWVGTLLSSLMLPFVWAANLPWQAWAGMLLMGLMGCVGHFMLILGYSRTPAAILTPYLYAQIGFAMLGGWLIFSHLPDTWSLTGIALIALSGAAGAWLTLREGHIPSRQADQV